MITKDLIIKYFEDHFDERDFKIKGQSIQANSPFKHDKKFHLGVSLKENTLGLWNDFKPPQDSGGFVKLVSLMKDISYGHAKSYLLENYLQYITLSREQSQRIINQNNREASEYPSIDLPPYCIPIIQKGVCSGYFKKGFLSFLKNDRNIDPAVVDERQIQCCYEGYYAGQIVIPFFDDNDNIIYWQAVNLQNKTKKNCPEEIAEGKGSGIGYNIFTDSSTILLVESVWDALRLPHESVGLLSNKITEMQIELLLKKPREEIIWIGDNYTSDKAGRESVDRNLKDIKNKIGDETKLKVFMWDGDYKPYKDLSRCDFNLDLDDIRAHCEPYGNMHDLKMKVLKDLN